jgi:hypothetical protein
VRLRVRGSGGGDGADHDQAARQERAREGSPVHLLHLLTAGDCGQDPGRIRLDYGASAAILPWGILRLAHLRIRSARPP